MTTENQENEETVFQGAENEKETQNTDNQDQQSTDEQADAEAPQAETEEEITSEESEVNELQKAQAELSEQKDKYVRLYAEFENFRRRTVKEKSDTIKNASQGLIKDLLPVIDDFERALKSMEEGQKKTFENQEDMLKELQAVEEGVKLIFNKLYKTLENKGLKAIDSAIGKEFNLEEHESITTIPAPSEDMKGKVIDEIEKGYYLHDKVLRFTKVVLGS